MFEFLQTFWLHFILITPQSTNIIIWNIKRGSPLWGWIISSDFIEFMTYFDNIIWLVAYYMIICNYFTIWPKIATVVAGATLSSFCTGPSIKPCLIHISWTFVRSDPWISTIGVSGSPLIGTGTLRLCPGIFRSHSPLKLEVFE